MPDAASSWFPGGMDIHLKSISDPVQGVFTLSTEGEYFDVVAIDVRMPSSPAMKSMPI